MQEDYIRTARAKGLSERRVIFRHGVRSAITPIVTLLGLDIGILLGGAILTETVFNIQGIGRFAYEAIVRFDLPVIQGTVLFGAFFIVIMSLVVDILYAFIDPGCGTDGRPAAAGGRGPPGPLRDRGRRWSRPSTGSPTPSTAARRSASSASPARASPCRR